MLSVTDTVSERDWVMNLVAEIESVTVTESERDWVMNLVAEIESVTVTVHGERSWLMACA